MHSPQKSLQWLVLWLILWLLTGLAAFIALIALIALTCSPLPLMAAETIAPSAPSAPLAPSPIIPSTEPEFETVHDGSIDNQAITALAQDARGLIWIGTQNGLIRYDGYRFRKYTYTANDPFSLPNNYVYALVAAKDGKIWIGNLSEGLSVFDPASERFETFRHDDKVAESLSDNKIWVLSRDEQDGIWIGTDHGLDYLKAGSKRFEHFKHSNDPHSLLDNKIRSLLFDKAGHLWVGTTQGLQRRSTDRKSFTTMVTGSEVHSLFEAQDGKLWLGTLEHGAAWLMPEVSPSQINWLPLAQLSHPWIAGITQVQADQIWLASLGGGITIVAASDGRILQTLRHDPTLPGSLALNDIKPFLLDRAGWLWVGTYGSGLQRINASNHLVRTLRHSKNRPNGLSHPDVRSVLELASGKILIGSSGNGIDIFDREKGLIGGYRANKDEPNPLPDASAISLAQTSDGTLWVGTQLAGVVLQRPGSTAWVTVQGLPNKHVRQLLIARDGSLWAGTDGGMARWRPDQTQDQAQDQTRNPTTALSLNPNPNQALPPVRFETLTDDQGKAMEAIVTTLQEDRQGRIWIGTESGLWLHEPGHKGLIRIPAEPAHPNGMYSGAIFGLLSDSHDRLWIITEKGLVRLKSWDGKQARFERLDALNARGGNLQEDQQGRIWTEEEMIDPTSLRIHRLTPADGINVGTLWISSYAQTRDGLLFFGGTKGLAIIDPKHFKAYDYAPPMVATELKINGETMPLGTIISPLANASAQAGKDTAANLTLEPAQRNFAIEFAALDYSDPKNNRYQYRLQGYDKNWIMANSEHRSAAYGNLWPGWYTLQVRGSNQLGQWSPHEISILIHVLPAWWQTWWFGLVLLLVVSSLIAALVQSRTRYLRQRQRELEQLVDERTSQLRQKQAELVDANQDLHQSNEALNEANVGLALSVETLRQLGDIGREITANLDAEIVFQSLYLYVGGLLEAPAMMIYRMNPSATALVAVFGREDEKIMPTSNIALDSATSNAARAARQRQELLVDYAPMDQPENDPNYIPGTRHMLTALFAPLIVDDRVLGVMSIQSDKPDAYGERERLIFRTLTAYGAIALANAAAMDALHQAQGQLVQQEKMASLGGLLAGMAHEINTPLGTTLVAISGAEGAWQTLQNAVASGRISKSMLESSTSAGMEYTSLALKTATRAAELITLFKTISVNPESDRPTEIELTSYLQEVASLISSRIEQNGCKLEVSAPNGLCIHAVPEALTETLSRILVNVLDHGFDQGRTGTLRIHAQLLDEAQYVTITINDDGHGIAPQDLPKVFDPFFTTKSGVHGHVGLGLHVAYNHVKHRLKGQIHITSTLGEGTSVEIRLKK